MHAREHRRAFKKPLKLSGTKQRATLAAVNRRWLRIGLLIAVLIGLFVVARATGLDEYFTRERVREVMQDAGFAGFAAYVGVFCVSLLVQIPGVPFVAGAALAYGWALGTVASIVASTIAVNLSFVIVRKIGGQPLEAIKQPFLRKWLDRLDESPIKSIIVIRFFLWALPPVNYTLAMSGIRFRDYAVGSALGLIAPMFYLSVLFDWALNGGAERLLRLLGEIFG